MNLVDGMPADSVPASDRGLNYGDGLFETMRLHAGEVPLLERHLARLQAGCFRLGLPYPGDATLAADIAQLAGDEEGHGIIRLTLTRGDGERGYAPPPAARGRRIATRHPLPPPGPPALTLGICRTRLGRSAALGGLKHLGRLEQVLAAGEAASAGWDEGLMLDAENFVIEGTRHNLFFVRGGAILTPPVGECGVAGVMRGLVLESIIDTGLRGGEAPLHYHELDDIDELLLCNAVAGIRAVRRLGEREFGGSTPVIEALRAPLIAAGVSWLA
jgi:4-amino-4-deoxychorismate lyase